MYADICVSSTSYSSWCSSRFNLPCCQTPLTSVVGRLNVDYYQQSKDPLQSSGRKNFSKYTSGRAICRRADELIPSIMSLDERFNAAAKEVTELVSQPADADLLEIYALYKQATVGDVNTARPGLLDFKGKAKWDSWESKKGTSQDEAKEKYIAKVASLVASIGKK